MNSPVPASFRGRQRLPLTLPPIAILGALILSGCMVGPNYNGPPEVARNTVSTAHFARESTVPGLSTLAKWRWWEETGDPVLQRLVEEALSSSPRVKVAQARVRSARAQLQSDRTNLLPRGEATATYARARIRTDGILSGSGGNGGSTSAISDPLDIGIYSAGFDASWEIDLFGGNRRGIESSQAALQAQQAELGDAQVQLASEVAKAYVQLREAQDRLVLLKRTDGIRSESIALNEQRRVAGTATAGDVEQLREQAAQTHADVTNLQFTVDEQLDQLAILTGREPGVPDPELGTGQDATVAQPMPPAAVAITDPYQWLRNRPDVRKAERTLAAQNAKIGQNVADYYPKVQLLGLIGFSGAAPSGLVHGSPTTVGLPSLSWNLLGIPKTRAKVRGAEADRDEAAADYQRTVLEALQDANDSLSRFGHQREAVAARQAAVAASRRLSALTQQRRASGTATSVDALDAERNALADEDQLCQANSQLMQAYVALQKSLGLGWGEGAPSLALVARQNSK